MKESIRAVLLEKKRKRKAQIRLRVALISVTFDMAAVAAGIALFMPSRKHILPEDYYAQKMLESAQGEGWSEQEQKELASALQGEALAVVLEDTVDPRRALMREDQLYLNYGMVYENLNRRFFWDEESQMMLFTTPH